MYLRGKRQICKYTKRSWATLQRLQKQDGFPMFFNGGRWEADSELINKYNRSKLQLIDKKGLVVTNRRQGAGNSFQRCMKPPYFCVGKCTICGSSGTLRHVDFLGNVKRVGNGISHGELIGSGQLCLSCRTLGPHLHNKEKMVIWAG